MKIGQLFYKEGIDLVNGSKGVDVVPEIIYVKAINYLSRSRTGLLEHSCKVAETVLKVLEMKPELSFGINHKDMVLAAFLHDISKTWWPPRYFESPLHLLSRIDQELIQTHPISGGVEAKLLNASEAVVSLIEQHHERQDGSGYPRKILKPHPAALLIGACDAYCACMESRCYRPKPLPVYEALREAAKVGLPEAVMALAQLDHVEEKGFIWSGLLQKEAIY